MLLKSCFVIGQTLGLLSLDLKFKVRETSYEIITTHRRKIKQSKTKQKTKNKILGHAGFFDFPLNLAHNSLLVTFFFSVTRFFKCQ